MMINNNIVPSGKDKVLLAFCIPTFNRAEILEEALLDLIDKIKRFGFIIIVSDNGSTDETQTVMCKYQKMYSSIIYYRHNTNLGYDLNVEFTLKLAADVAQYSWLLGDSYRIVANELNNIIAILNRSRYTLVVLNTNSRIQNVASREYHSVAELITTIGWHMTLIGALIMSDRLVKHNAFYRYHNTYLIQFGIIYEYLACYPDCEVYWYATNSIYSTSKSKLATSWNSQTFKVFGENWCQLVLSLPQTIPLKNKRYCILQHNIKTTLFELDNLYRLKSLGWLDYNNDVKPYKQFNCLASLTPWWMIMTIALSPRFLDGILKPILRGYEKINKKGMRYRKLNN